MKNKLIIGGFLILIAIIGTISWEYEKYKESLLEQPPYFDLFIVQFFGIKKAENPWGKVSKKEKRPVNWLFYINDFEKLDSVYLGFENYTKEKFFYVTWGKPNSRIRVNYVVFKNGKKELIPSDFFACGTGIYLESINNNETVGSKILNPLMFHPITNYPLPLKDPKLPQLLQELYGDSIEMKFEQATYSLPWNKYPSQMIESPPIIVKTKDLIKNWEKEKFINNQE